MARLGSRTPFGFGPKAAAKTIPLRRSSQLSHRTRHPARVTILDKDPAWLIL